MSTNQAEERFDRIVGEDFIDIFKVMQGRIHENNKAKGFWDEKRNDGEALMLVVTELAEGLEYLRKGNGPSDHIPDFLGIEEEIADAVIRLMDFAGGRGFRLPEAIVAKLAYNRTRPHKHGKSF